MMTIEELKKMPPKQKAELKRQAAHRILAGYGFTRHSSNIGTTYGFSFDNFRGHSKVFESLQEMLAKEGIKFDVRAASYVLQLNVSSVAANLVKFISLGEEIWAKTVEKYLPMIDELEAIQSKIDSRPLKSKDRFNYIVSRSCFADYLREKLLKYETVENYENEIKVFTKLVEVQNDLKAVINAYKENRSDLGKFNAMLANKLSEEYERLTGEDIDKAI